MVAVQFRGTIAAALGKALQFALTLFLDNSSTDLLSSGVQYTAANGANDKTNDDDSADRKGEE